MYGNIYTDEFWAGGPIIWFTLGLLVIIAGLVSVGLEWASKANRRRKKEIESFRIYNGEIFAAACIVGGSLMFCSWLGALSAESNHEKSLKKMATESSRNAHIYTLIDGGKWTYHNDGTVKFKACDRLLELKIEEWQDEWFTVHPRNSGVKFSSGDFVPEENCDLF